MFKNFEGKKFSQKLFAYIDVLIWDVVYVFEPDAIGKSVSRVNVLFWFRSSSTGRTCPAA